MNLNSGKQKKKLKIPYSRRINSIYPEQATDIVYAIYPPFLQHKFAKEGRIHFSKLKTEFFLPDVNRFYSDLVIDFDSDSESKNLKLNNENQIQKPNPDQFENFFDWLPEEIILMIFEFLDEPYALTFCEATCSKFYRISREPELWRKCLKKYAPNLDYFEVNVSSWGYLGSFTSHFYFKGILGLTYYFEEEDKKETEKIQEIQEEINLENKINKNRNKSQKSSVIYSEIDPESRRKLLEQSIFLEDQEIEMIQKNPKKLFLQQIGKFDYELKKTIKAEKYYRKHKEKDCALMATGPFSPMLLPIIFAIGFLINLILLTLRLDDKSSTSYEKIFVPIEIVCFAFLYASFFTLFTTGDLIFYRFNIAVSISSLSMFVFFLLLSIKLDHSSAFPWFVIIFPFLLSFAGWISFVFSIFSKVKSEKQVLDNIMVLYLIWFHLPFLIFLILLILYLHDIGSLSYTSIFLPLLLIPVIPIVYTVICLFFVRYSRKNVESWSDMKQIPEKNESYLNIFLLSMLFFLIPTILIFVQVLIIYLKLDDKIGSKWAVVSIPSFIILSLVFCGSCIGSLKVF